MGREGEAAMRCLPKEVAAADAVLAAVDGAVAVVAFLQLFRIHLRNQQLGWTRQKIFHLMIGSSNIGYLAYFISALVATCKGWQCWSHGCGFVLMVGPQIIFFAAFLLLISFWVDLCHQASDDEEEDYERGYSEALLDKSMDKQGRLHVDGCRVLCFPRAIHVGSRQKFVILVIALTFISMIVFSILIWIGGGKNSIDSSIAARVYLYTFSAAMLLLGGALASYGTLLFSKMSKVRSEMASTEMWKVASLAAVSVLSFTSSAVLALSTTVPLEMLSHWPSQHSENLISSIFIFLYYFIGSSVPSGFVLWVMRDMPPPHVAYTHRPSQSTVVTFIRERDSASQNPQWRDTVTSSQNKKQWRIPFTSHHPRRQATKVASNT
ncbi:tobamovirus multiplication protein 1-like isoform X1 [Zingiber officinale]|uniref:tobamovirus multiplication protein 1-like isoform X1 n=1 Tax=Zingiber officinale TaxID=94328 RepID=UPI001C4BEB0B|nr:tobamovirus multiplication protein 1-like isoform X1 [Zingiber officinale]